MFPQQLSGVGGNQGVSRPFIVGLVLLLLFLSFHTDLGGGTSSSNSSSSRREMKQVVAQDQIKEGVKEKILLELSVVNEKLETENRRLKQYVLDMRRAMRGCGCELNATAGQYVFPELHENPDEHFRETDSAGAGESTAPGDPIQGPDTRQPDLIPVHSRNNS